MWNYTWFRHNLSEAFTTVRAHRVSRHTYSISALTSEDSGPYWCKARNQDTNFTLLSSPVFLSVIAGKSEKQVPPVHLTFGFNMELFFTKQYKIIFMVKTWDTSVSLFLV